ncbi:MAG: hypothetical protein A3I05_09785 [Deltaproteobacteria bacterium RIFCSPLOWO2_02_FULL_44_10]|nr:MAG: hypothetical protein A3C46_09400 [Deltaproteobacteria bacterium RIFCSPHIGHO2_02_FULL_44_16]OGQ44985.1 MAG: hypothetical protein A3I05_09785 [Deltaproteobacteria bacterium RIFCSPLOWO2_02_FULL_44_10]
MKDAGLTRQERSLRAWMKLWTVLFLLAAAVVAFFPDWILTYITNIGHTLLGWRGPRPSLTQHSFWLVLAVSLMLTQAYLCFLVAYDPVRNASFSKIIIFAKACSTIAYVISYFFMDPYFIYVTGAVIDGIIFFAMLMTYRLSVVSRPD